MASSVFAAFRLWGGLALALAAPPFAAAAIEAPAPPQNAAAGSATSGDAENVVVTARQPGPAVWRLRKNAADVILIGVLQRDLKAQTWNLNRVDRLMDGASALYVYRSGVRLATSNPLDVFRAPGWLARAHLPRGTRVKEVVGDELWGRYRMLSSSLGVDEKLDDTFKPFFFGFAFENAAFAHLGLQSDRATGAILKLAQKRHIKVTSLDAYPLVKTADDILNIPAPDGVICFKEAVEAVTFGAEHGAAASLAWSIGDLKTVRANTISLKRACLAAMPALSKLVSERTEEIVRLVDLALDRPGKTIFVIPLEPLLQHEGVLEKVHAEGAAVTSPSL